MQADRDLKNPLKPVLNQTRADVRRSEIAMKSASLFIRKGYLKTSVRDIAQECGMSMGALYHYFCSKEDILSWFLEMSASDMIKFREERLSSLHTMDPPGAVRYGIKRYLEWIDIHQDVVLFWYQESRNLPPGQVGKLMRQEEELAAVFEEVLTFGCEAGAFEVDNLALASHWTVILCHMWALRRWSLAGNYPLEEYASLLADWILRAISKPES